MTEAPTTTSVDTVSGPAPPPPLLLFVHGSWHGAWCWDTVRERAESRGYRTHALDLPGHGERRAREDVRGARFSHFVSALARRIEDLDHPGPLVLVGHSLGGAVVQAYLKEHGQEKWQEKGQRSAVAAAVLVASVPPHGVLFSTLRFAGRHPVQLLKCVFRWDLWPVVETPELAWEALRSSALRSSGDAAAADDKRAFHGRLQHESFWGYLAELRPDLLRPSKVSCPVLVIGAGGDRLFARWEVERTARAYGTEAKFFPGGHDLMLEPAGTEMTDAMLRWLGGQGLGAPALPAMG